MKYQETFQPVLHSSMASYLTPYFYHRRSQKFLSDTHRINEKHEFCNSSDIHVKLSVNKMTQIELQRIKYGMKEDSVLEMSFVVEMQEFCLALVWPTACCQMACTLGISIGVHTCKGFASVVPPVRFWFSSLSKACVRV